MDTGGGGRGTRGDSVLHGVPVYFPVYAMEKLYCLLTVSHACERLDHGLTRKQTG